MNFPRLGLPLALACSVAACGGDVILFEPDEGPPDQIPSGGTSGGGGSGGDRGGFGGFGGEENPTTVGFPADAEVFGFRILVFSRPPSLNTQFRAITFLTDGGGRFPATGLSEGDPDVILGQVAGNPSEPIRAFDDDESTWWELRGDYYPGYIEIVAADALDIPQRVFLDVHQAHERAPSDFDVLAYDGANFWTILSVRGLKAWEEPGDEVLWQQDQRTFELLEPELWYR